MLRFRLLVIVEMMMPLLGLVMSLEEMWEMG